MAFRATKGNAYTTARNVAARLKQLAIDTRDASAASSISANVIRQLLDRLIEADATLTTAGAIPGIAAYAQTQEGDETYDLAAEFSAMMAEIDATITWILGAIPVSGGWVQLEQWTASGVTVRTFSTAQTAGLRTQLDLLIATID